MTWTTSPPCFPDDLGAPEQRVSAAARVVHDGDFAPGDAAAGDLLAQAVALAVVAHVAAQQLAVCNRLLELFSLYVVIPVMGVFP